MRRPQQSTVGKNEKATIDQIVRINEVEAQQPSGQNIGDGLLNPLRQKRLGSFCLLKNTRGAPV